ncbi:MAG: CTP synthetase [Halobacteriaceae archaeon]
MTAVLIAGPERGLGAAFEARGVAVERLAGVVTRDRLLEAGVEDVDVYVLTDVSEATSIPIALEANPDATVVVYSPDTMPEFVRAQVDLAIDPAVLDAADVAEALLDRE